MASGLKENYCEVWELYLPRATTKCIPHFDLTNNFSDHHYAYTKQSTHGDGGATYKAIFKEWKILEKDLPDSIYVRADEIRCDLMRAAIIGPSGTPYHDGLFFFDIFFPEDYPNQPPKVHYRSFGLRINPNLYSNGFVCLSLLNTWNGYPAERWIPSQSTMFQVLLSIQAFVLNEKPYFNEPGIRGNEEQSKIYTQNAFMLSCKSMVHLLQNPPKSFEVLVARHFYDRSYTILSACQAYINGFQRVGYYQNNQSFLEETVQVSQVFKHSMEKEYKNLAAAFGTIDPTVVMFRVKLDKMVAETQLKYKA